MERTKSILPFVYWILFIIWGIHLYTHLTYDKFAHVGDGAYFTDEGYWNYPARHKYLFGTWTDSECHYNHRIYNTPIFELIQYVSMKVFGLNPRAIRLPSLMFFILTFLILTFYIIKIRKKSYIVAILVMFPFLIERFFLVRFTAALLESLLVFLVTLAFVFYKMHLYKKENLFLILSLFTLILAYFVKSYVILFAIPFILLLDSSLSKKILLGALVFSIPILWNYYLKIYHPHAFHSIYYDLFSCPRTEDLLRIITGVRVVEANYVFMTPIFWFVIYYLLFKSSSNMLFKNDLILAFDMALILYISEIFLMMNLMRYNLPLIPAYVDMAIYLSDKKFVFTKKWLLKILIITIFYTILALSFVYLNEYPLSRKLVVLILETTLFVTLLRSGSKIGDSLFITFLIGGTMWNLDTINHFRFTILAYFLIPNLLLPLIDINNENDSKGIPFLVVVLILYSLTSTYWVKSEIRYFKGKNNFRTTVLKCISQHLSIPTMAGGRGVDNYTLFETRVRTLGILGPDYDAIRKRHRKVKIRSYRINKNCLKDKNVLIFGYPYTKDSTLNSRYIKRILNALPLKPKDVKRVTTCQFVFDIDSTNYEAIYNLPVYIFSF